MCSVQGVLRKTQQKWPIGSCTCSGLGTQRNGWAQGWICESGVEISEDLGVDDIVPGLSRAGEKVALAQASEVSI